MEPITHLMTGACMARAGLNRKAAYATLAMTLAAEAPDLDTVWTLRGPVAGLQHHRGITHTFLGLPFEAGLILGAVYLIHRYRLRRAALQPAPAAVAGSESTDQTIVRPLTAAPIRWPLLYGFSLLALLSHLMLDWTNNYGLRPFFPFNPHWYSGSIVFIFEPVIFALLLLALVAPSLFSLISSEVGTRREHFRGRNWAVFALAAIVALWTVRYTQRAAALNLAQTNLAADPDTHAAVPILRLFASPYPVNPFRWAIVTETPDFYQLATADTRANSLTSSPTGLVYKPPATLGTLVAKRTWLGEAYLDWSSWPIVNDIGPVAGFARGGALTAPAAPPGTTAVTLRDLRFMYDTFFLNGRSQPPITGTVYLNPDRRVIRTELDGTAQK